MRRAGSGPQTVVVGAGAVGLFCADALSRRGADVTVLAAGFSSRFDPLAASWAAAGMLGALSEAVGVEAHGHPQAGALALDALNAWDRWRGRLDGSAPVNDCGAWILGDSPARDARLERAAAEARASGRTASLFEGARLREAAPHVRAPRALWAPFEAVVDIPGAFARLTADLAARDVPVREDVVVVGLERRRVWLASGEALPAEAIILAPGLGQAGALTEAAPALAHLSPAKGQMIALAATLAATVRGEGVYAAPRGDHVVVGATMEAGRGDRNVDPDVSAALQAAAALRVPALAAAARLDAWAGVRPMSPDGAPLLGPDGPAGALLAAGHSRNGWLLAPLSGEIIAAYVFGEPIAPLHAAFVPQRFEGPPS